MSFINSIAGRTVYLRSSNQSAYCNKWSLTMVLTYNANDKSTISLSSTTPSFGGSVTVTAGNVADASNTHQVKLYVAGTHIRTDNMAAGVKTFSLPLTESQLQTYFTSKKSENAVVKLVTIAADGTQLGIVEQAIVINVPDSYAPTFSTSGIYTVIGGFNSLILQGRSKLKFKVNATPKNGATVTGVQVNLTVGGKTATYVTAANNTEVTGYTLKSSGTNTFTIIVTDSRGLQRSASLNVTVTAYSAPVISSVTHTRCASDGTADEDGTYARVRATMAVSGVSGNSGTMTVKFTA